MQYQIKRALISVYNKDGLLPLVSSLKEWGVELISTGGTAKALREAGHVVTDVATLTQHPEAFGGRVKTLSPLLLGGILFERERDKEEAARLGVQAVDLVVCNLYPFWEVAEGDIAIAERVELIDIGGPTMIRAAAKNFRYVACVSSPKQYQCVMEELAGNSGALTLETRQRLMAEAFEHTAEYDAMIAATMVTTLTNAQEAAVQRRNLHYVHGVQLNYGENPHQTASVFYPRSKEAYSLEQLQQLGGSALSFNNIVDLSAAIDAVRHQSAPTCAVIKHANPCGIYQSSVVERLIDGAWACDPVSAFGSIICINRPVSLAMVSCFKLDRPVAERRFVEMLAAPSFEPEAVEYLQQSKRLRIIAIDPDKFIDAPDQRVVKGVLLEQSPDVELVAKREIVTSRGFDDAHLALVAFGAHAVRSVKSNAIVIVEALRNGDLRMVGAGAGQPNRVNSVSIALKMAGETFAREYAASCTETPSADALSAAVKQRMGQTVLFSDAFFPFPDSIDNAVEHGIRYIVQPGGSIRDKDVVEACDRQGVAMMLTGMRHFKH